MNRRMGRGLGGRRGRNSLIGVISAALVGLVMNACLHTGDGRAGKGAQQQSGRANTELVAMSGAVALAQLPPEAQTVLHTIQNRGSFPHRQDGQTFGNREGVLPQQNRGYYQEYTVPTPGASNRGARRIVAGKGATGDVATSGEYYYTADHYRSFARIQMEKP